MAGAHFFIELRLGEVERGVAGSLILRLEFHELRRGRCEFAVKNDPLSAGFTAGHTEEILCRCVQVLRILGIGNPDRLVLAENAGEPEHLAEQVGEALVVVCVSEDELLLPAAVKAGGDGYGLAIAGLDEFELAEVDRLANGVVNEALGVGLFHGRNNVSKRDSNAARKLGVKSMRTAVSELHFTVHDIGVRSRCGAMKRPLEFAEGDGQASERYIALRPRIAQALGGSGQVRLHLGQQLWLFKVKGGAQLQFEATVSEAGKSQLEDGSRVAVEVGAGGGGDEGEACVLRSGFERCGECCAHFEVLAICAKRLDWYPLILEHGAIAWSRRSAPAVRQPLAIHSQEDCGVSSAGALEQIAFCYTADSFPELLEIPMKFRVWTVALALIPTLAVLPAVAQGASGKPKVRAITAFVRLDHAHFEEQIAAAVAVLHRVEKQFEDAGYEVQTIRITTQPVAELTAGMDEAQALKYLGELDKLSVEDKFIPDVGPAMLHDSDNEAAMHLLERALSTLPNIEGSAIIADDDGIHWKTIERTAELVKYVAAHSPHSQGNFNFTATAMLKPLGPFFPGSYHLGSGKAFAVGYEGANLVQEVFAKDSGNANAAVKDLTAALTVHARVAERIGNEVAAETGWSYAGLDPTPAPLGDVSIGAAMEAFTGAKFGSSGTMTAARIITTAVKAVPVKQTGYSGLMVPVMEDKLLAERWAEGTYTIDSLLAYSSVCGTGLDTVPLPGNVSVKQLEWMFGDVASLAYKWHKPLSARLFPIAGGNRGIPPRSTIRFCSTRSCERCPKFPASNGKGWPIYNGICAA